VTFTAPTQPQRPFAAHAAAEAAVNTAEQAWVATYLKRPDAGGQWPDGVEVSITFSVMRGPSQPRTPGAFGSGHAGAGRVAATGEQRRGMVCVPGVVGSAVDAGGGITADGAVVQLKGGDQFVVPGEAAGLPSLAGIALTVGKAHCESGLWHAEVSW
jgi:hypothetical protein